MRRRTFLGAGAAVAASAGCLGLFETRTQSVRAPPLVEGRPDAVYVPTHVEGMNVVDTASAGRYEFALSYSFPHRFWLVTGDRRERVTVGDDDSVHLMVTVRDAETGVALPTSNAAVEVARDGETVVSKSMWPMLSQTMGVHFGDNVALPGEGSYAVTATFGPIETRTTGGFAGAFDAPSTASFALEFDRERLEELSFERLEDRQGQLGAVGPMDTGTLSIEQLPEADALPGNPAGVAGSGGARLAVTVLPEPPEGIDGAGAYLAVSARTPYNRFPLPMMSLSATLTRGGETALETPLRAALDPDLRYHYGAVVDGLAAGDTIELVPGAPPQVARHEGYETAFFDAPPAELTI